MNSIEPQAPIIQQAIKENLQFWHATAGRVASHVGNHTVPESVKDLAGTANR